MHLCIYAQFKINKVRRLSLKKDYQLDIQFSEVIQEDTITSILLRTVKKSCVMQFSPTLRLSNEIKCRSKNSRWFFVH